MFVVNDDLSIYLTRGDTAFITVSAEEDGTTYKFQPGDVVQFKVTEKKDCDRVVLQKKFLVTEEAEKVDIFLKEAETKIGGVISRPVDYWYEIELNPDTNPQTIIGYDEDGAKVLKLFPEGRDLEDDTITEEDIPVVDKELDLGSTRPVQNQAIARKFASLTARDVGAFPATGGWLTGDMYFKRAENGYGAIFKLHSEAADYGTQIRDDDKNGNVLRLIVSAANQRLALRTNDGTEHELFGVHNTDLLNEKIRHYMKDYTDLTQIGLTLGSETIESIATNLPAYSRLYLTVGQGNNMSIYPNGNYGLLVVEKTVNSRIVFNFTNNQANRWTGVFAINSGGNTWTDWKE